MHQDKSEFATLTLTYKHKRDSSRFSEAKRRERLRLQFETIRGLVSEDNLKNSTKEEVFESVIQVLDLFVII